MYGQVFRSINVRLVVWRYYNGNILRDKEKMIKRNTKRHKSCQMVSSTLVCPKCKNKVIIWRPAAHKREKGHLKRLYCYKCKRKINHKELGEYGDICVR